MPKSTPPATPDHRLGQVGDLTDLDGLHRVPLGLLEVAGERGEHGPRVDVRPAKARKAETVDDPLDLLEAHPGRDHLSERRLGPHEMGQRPERPLRIVLPLRRLKGLLLDLEPRSGEGPTPVEGSPSGGKDGVERGPVPDGPSHLQGLGRGLPPAVDVPSPLQLDRDRRQQLGAHGRRPVGHAGERLVVEGELLLADEPDLGRHPERRQDQRGPNQPLGIAEGPCHVGGGEHGGPPPRVPGVAEGCGEVEQQVTSQLEDGTCEQLQQT